MNDHPNRRDEAIKARREREAQRTQAAAAKMQHDARHFQQQQQFLTAWATFAANTISLGVLGCGGDFARRGSEFIIAAEPPDHPGVLEFHVRRRGARGSIAELSFALQEDGTVCATTTARGAHLPEAVAVDAVTAKWADDTAERVMLSVLNAGVEANPRRR
jgi:hypothetical protein